MISSVALSSWSASFAWSASPVGSCFEARLPSGLIIPSFLLPVAFWGEDFFQEPFGPHDRQSLCPGNLEHPAPLG